MLISAALDAFYDIFSEDYYNQALTDCGVLEQMEKGHQGLVTLYKRSRSEKLLNKNELANADNALENLLPFIAYKKKEMNLK